MEPPKCCVSVAGRQSSQNEKKKHCSKKYCGSSFVSMAKAMKAMKAAAALAAPAKKKAMKALKANAMKAMRAKK